MRGSERKKSLDRKMMKIKKQEKDGRKRVTYKTENQDVC